MMFVPFNVSDDQVLWTDEKTLELKSVQVLTNYNLGLMKVCRKKDKSDTYKAVWSHAVEEAHC